MDLTEQVVLITGGSRGLGLAFAQALAEADARIAITGRSPDALQQALAQLNRPREQVRAVCADVTDQQATEHVIATIEEQLGPITVLINNAGQLRSFGPIDGLRNSGKKLLKRRVGQGKHHRFQKEPSFAVPDAKTKRKPLCFAIHLSGVVDPALWWREIEINVRGPSDYSVH